MFWKKKHWEDEYDKYYERDIDRSVRPFRFRYLPHALLVLLFAGIFFAVVAAVSGTTMVEKMLTGLAMPAGLLWVGLLTTIYFCLVNRQAWPATVCFLCWLLLTVAGNGVVSNWFARTVESQWQNELDSLSENPVDLLVVLGGGTTTRLSGEPQASFGGDRIIQAARIWHAGETKMLMCTGKQTYKNWDKDLDPHEEAKLLLEELGVPRSDILELNGENTSEEIANLKRWSDKHPDKRIGLLTSAWHLSRAMRLAAANELDVQPVPSHFLSEPFAPEPDVIIPSEASLLVTAAIAKEYLAGWVGR